MRSAVTSTGGTVQALNSVGNTITVSVAERVEGTCDDSKGLMYYNYRRGMQSIFKYIPYAYLE